MINTVKHWQRKTQHWPSHLKRKQAGKSSFADEASDEKLWGFRKPLPVKGELHNVYRLGLLELILSRVT